MRARTVILLVVALILFLLLYPYAQWIASSQ